MSSGFWWLNLWKIKISHLSSEKGNPLELIMKGCPQWVSVSPCSCLQTGFWLTSKHAILLKSSVGLSIFLDFSLFFLNLVFSSLSPALHILLNVFYLWTLNSPTLQLADDYSKCFNFPSLMLKAEFLSSSEKTLLPDTNNVTGKWWMCYMCCYTSQWKVMQ